MKDYQNSLKQIVLFLTLAILPLSATLYEDAEDGVTTGWVIYAGNTVDVNISNVDDAEKGSKVIELSGNGEENGYRLGNVGGRGYADAANNSTEKNLKWSMKYNESFTIYIAIQTAKGNRYLTYTNKSEANKGLFGSVVHHGLGTDASDGTWKMFTRDLEVDWNEFVTDDPIISVNGFFIKGSGRVDDISLKP